MAEEDLSAVLVERHALLAWLEMQVAELPKSDTRALYLEKLATALGGHLRSVEHGTNKALRKIFADGLPEQVLEKYTSVATRLAQVLAAGEAAFDFQERYLMLTSAVAGMCAMERRLVMPTLYRSLNEAALVLIAFEVERQFEEFVGARGSADATEASAKAKGVRRSA